MQCNYRIDMPPMLTGDTAKDMRGIWAWLYRMAERVNAARGVDAEKDTEPLPEAGNGPEKAVLAERELNRKMGITADALYEEMRCTQAALSARIDGVRENGAEETEELRAALAKHDHGENYAARDHAHALKDGAADAQIRWGSARMGAVKAGHTGSERVLFDPPFPQGSIPIVTIAPVTASADKDMGRCAIAVLPASVSETEFTARFYNSNASEDSDSFEPAFHYIAIAETEQEA